MTTCSSPSSSCRRIDRFRHRRGDIATDIISPNGQLTMAPVHQDRKLNRSRSSEIHQPVERSADGTPGEEHIIYRELRACRSGETESLSVRFRVINTMPQIIAVHGDIHHPSGTVSPSMACNLSASRRANEFPVSGCRLALHPGSLWYAPGSRGQCASGPDQSPPRP